MSDVDLRHLEKQLVWFTLAEGTLAWECISGESSWSLRWDSPLARYWTNLYKDLV